MQHIAYSRLVLIRYVRTILIVQYLTLVVRLSVVQAVDQSDLQLELHSILLVKGKRVPDYWMEACIQTLNGIRI